MILPFPKVETNGITVCSTWLHLYSVCSTRVWFLLVIRQFHSVPTFRVIHLVFTNWDTLAMCISTSMCSLPDGWILYFADVNCLGTAARPLHKVEFHSSGGPFLPMVLHFAAPQWMPVQVVRLRGVTASELLASYYQAFRWDTVCRCPTPPVNT